MQPLVAVMVGVLDLVDTCDAVRDENAGAAAVVDRDIEPRGSIGSSRG
jgi:hypothetical protein